MITGSDHPRSAAAIESGSRGMRTFESSGKHPSAAALCTSDGNQASASESESGGAQAPLGVPQSVPTRTTSGFSRVRASGAAPAA